jgi:3-deoxy-D-manno-octulosonic-acid transferase
VGGGILAAMASISLWSYRVLLRLILPLAVTVLWIHDRVTGKRRPPVRTRLGRSLPTVAPGGIWIQAVSVGEVEVARRLVVELQRRGVTPPVLITATTATGLDLARRTLGQQVPVAPCPLDLRGPVARILEAARPRLLVLVETELWPELIHQSGRRGVPVAVVNGRLSDGAFARYRRVRSLLPSLLAPLTLVLAREISDCERFTNLGIAGHRIRVMGNIKYDLEPDDTSLDWEEAARSLAGDRPVIVAGSTMEGEEPIVLDAVDRLRAHEREPFLVLAPRHPERFEAVADLLAERDVPFVRCGRIEQLPRAADALLLDTIGELARAYRLASAAFIGGSLVPTGGHNPLEPAVWGVPVLTGPHVFNFQEVYDELAAAGAARIIADGSGLADVLQLWLEDPDAARSAGEAGRTVVEANRGATARTVDVLLELMGGVD